MTDIDLNATKASTLDQNLDAIMHNIHVLYDISKVLPHPYDAYNEATSKLLHDFAAVAFSVKAEVAKLTEERDGLAAVFGAEERGAMIDGLILLRQNALQRKMVNPESTSDIQADEAARLIATLGDPNWPTAILAARDAEKKAEGWDEGAQYVLDMYDFGPYRDKNPYRTPQQGEQA